MATEIDALQISIESNSADASEQIDRLAKSLENLKENSKVTKTVNALNKLNEAVAKFSTGNKAISKLNKLSYSLSKFNSLDSKGLSKMSNALKKIPDVVNRLDDKVLQSFTNKVKQLNKAMNNTNVIVSKPNKNTIAGFFGNMKLSTAGMIVALKKAADYVGESVTKINDYIETMNLFQTSMGSYFEEARKYAEKVNDVMGIDTSEWMNAQGIFMSMAKGFGLAEDRAYALSKGLTEVAYDISSFNNIPIEQALSKVRSGLAGEIEPLRQLGYALSEASLQQLAYEKGITQSVSSMTEAQKAILRYTAIVEQSMAMGKIGDLAKTLESPANAIRILKQQFMQLSRAVGSVFIPVLVQVLPYVQAVTKVLTGLISKLAVLVGFEMPDWDNKGLGGITAGAEIATESLDGAVDSAKKLKNMTASIDEFNIIEDEKTSSGAGAGIGAGGDLPIDIAEVWNEGMLGAVNTKVDELTRKMETFSLVLYDKFVKPLQGIDFEPLMNSLTRLWEAVQPFAGAIGEGLYWFYLNVLVPLAGWTIESALPTFLNATASALEFLTPYLYQFGNWVVENKDNIASLIPIIASFGAAFLIVKGLDLGKLFKDKGNISAMKGSLEAITESVSHFGKAVSTNYVFGGGGFSGVLQVLKTGIASFGLALKGLLAPIAPIAGVILAIGSAIYVLYQNWDKVVEVFQSFIKNIDLKGKFDAIKEAIAPLAEKFAGLSDLFTVIGTIVITALQPALAILAGLFNGFLSIIPPVIDIFGGIIDVLSGVGSYIIAIFTGDMAKAEEAIDKMVDGVIAIFGGMWNAVVGFISGFVDGVISWFVSLAEGVGLNISGAWQSIKDFFGGLYGSIATPISNFVDSVGDWFKKLWMDQISPWFSINKWIELGKKAINGLLDGFKSIGNSISNWFSNLFGGIEEEAKGKAGRVASNVGALGRADGRTSFVLPHVVPIQVFANGGFIEDGLFTMNRNEMAGRFSNGQSVVANNEMIVDGIARGVYRAVLQAFRDNGNDNKDNNFYIDGKKMTKKIAQVAKQIEKETGINPFF